MMQTPGYIVMMEHNLSNLHGGTYLYDCLNARGASNGNVSGWRLVSINKPLNRWHLFQLIIVLASRCSRMELELAINDLLPLVLRRPSSARAFLELMMARPDLSRGSISVTLAFPPQSQRRRMSTDTLVWSCSLAGCSYPDSKRG